MKGSVTLANLRGLHREPIIARTSVDYERLLVENLPLLESVVRVIARRHHLSSHDVEDLTSAIKLKLVENNYAALRKWEGRSQLRTYFTTIVHHHLIDERNARWGKWRPSVEARRLGPVAILLDQLLTRDGMTFDNAVETIAVRYGDTAVSREELHKIAVRLPARSSRVFVGDEQLEHVASATPTAVETLEARELGPIGDRVERALTSVLRRQNDEDRAILHLRFCGGLKLARIAELLGLPAKPFYRRVDDLMRSLRHALEAEGISDADVAALTEYPDALGGDLLEQASTGKMQGRPSVP